MRNQNYILTHINQNYITKITSTYQIFKKNEMQNYFYENGRSTRVG